MLVRIEKGNQRAKRIVATRPEIRTDAAGDVWVALNDPENDTVATIYADIEQLRAVLAEAEYQLLARYAP